MQVWRVFSKRMMPMPIRFLVLCLSLALAAGAPAMAAEQNARPVAAVGSPEAFAQRLLRQLNGTGAGGWVASNHTRQVDPTFARLMSENGRLAGSRYDGVDLDYDPICQCQDEGGRHVMTALTRTAADTAQIAIRQGGGAGQAEPAAHYQIVLKLSGGVWRIFDVIEPTDGSVRARLIRHNACMATRRGSAAIDRCFAGR